MAHRKQVLLLLTFAAGIGLFFVPFVGMPLAPMSPFDFVAGALSGGTWQPARIALAFLFVLLIAGFVWSAFRLLARVSGGSTGRAA